MGTLRLQICSGLPSWLLISRGAPLSSCSFTSCFEARNPSIGSVLHTGHTGERCSHSSTHLTMPPAPEATSIHAHCCYCYYSPTNITWHCSRFKYNFLSVGMLSFIGAQSG
eukprot:2250320-Amphidinium_carterae.1